MTMHTVIETPEYLQDAKDAGLSGDEMTAIIQIIASDPKAGDLMVGTGGARKLRFAAGGKPELPCTTGPYHQVTRLGVGRDDLNDGRHLVSGQARVLGVLQVFRSFDDRMHGHIYGNAV